MTGAIFTELLALGVSLMNVWMCVEDPSDCEREWRGYLLVLVFRGILSSGMEEDRRLAAASLPFTLSAACIAPLSSFFARWTWLKGRGKLLGKLVWCSFTL